MSTEKAVDIESNPSATKEPLMEAKIFTTEKVEGIFYYGFLFHKKYCDTSLIKRLQFTINQLLIYFMQHIHIHG